MKPTFFTKRLFFLLAALAAMVLLCSGCDKIREEKLLQQLTEAQTLIEEEDFQNAQTLLMQLTEEYPQDARAYGLLADLYLLENDWQTARETLKTGIETAGSPQSLTEKLESLEKKIAAQDKAASILQPVVSYWEDLYFWKYSSQGVESRSVSPSYSFSGENQLVRRTPEGEETVLYTGTGGGSLLLFHGKIYFSAGEKGMGAVPIEGGEASFVENAAPAGCDLSTDRLLFSIQSGSVAAISAMDTSGNTTEIAQGKLLAVSEGRVYYQPPREENTLWLQLWAVNTDGSQGKALCQMVADSSQGERQIQQVQIMEDTVYFSYGIYEQNTGSFADGGIIRVHADGTGFKMLAETSSPQFLAYLDGDAPMLRYQPQAEEGTNAPACQTLNINTGTTAVSALPCGPQGVPFDDGKGNLWVYSDLSGTPSQLLSSSEGFLSAGALPSGAEHHNTSWKTVTEACIAGDTLYFTVVESTYDYNNGSPCFVRVSSQAMCKSLTTGKTQLLYSY